MLRITDISKLCFLSIVLAFPLTAATVDFERDVAPIIAKRCLECHNERDAAGKLILLTDEQLKAGGENGPVVVHGKPDESFLLQRVVDGDMPPPRRGLSQKLPQNETEILRSWIEQGANWPAGRKLDLYERTTDVRAGRDWWSLQPIVRPPLPQNSNTEQAITAVDSFVLAKLEAANFDPAPTADRRTLITRLYYDLLGFPPTLDEINEFGANPSPHAYPELVDRLLASPHFGERWGRVWLDLVRYAETSGYERDQPKPHAWRYRDWVVRSINEDLPYDRFVLEQLAGDEVDWKSEDTVIATGFLRLGTWNDEPNDPQEYKYERLEDMVHTASTSFLGLTVKCARCHDHKFDPIPQVDYYRLASAFWPGPIEPRDNKLLGGPSTEELGFDVLGWTDLSAAPPPLHLLKKGDPKHPGPEVDPGQLSLVSTIRGESSPGSNSKTTLRRRRFAEWIIGDQNPLAARVIVNRIWQHHFGAGLVRTPNDFGFNGQRPTHPELLDWLASELIQSGWSLKHIHRLIVSSNTYQQASLHPRYSEYSQKDSNNELWWRMSRRRLDAESIRDSLLFVAGELDSRIGGPSFKPTIEPDALEGLSRKSAAYEASPAAEQRRRSLYIFIQRSLLPPLLTTFDTPDTTLPCGNRDVTTVAPQALALLNNRFVREQSEAVARQVQQADETSLVEQIRRAWQVVLRRAPDEQELAMAAEHVQQQQEWFRSLPQLSSDGNERRDEHASFLAFASLCHVLVNSNEFLYVD